MPRSVGIAVVLVHVDIGLPTNSNVDRLFLRHADTPP
jgi:hypothetical protein